MAKAPSFGKNQSARYHEFNPDDTIRGGLKTPVYGKGKISHMAPNYPAPESSPNTMGHQHVNTSKRKGK